jgi:hypothetical protein
MSANGQKGIRPNRVTEEKFTEILIAVLNKYGALNLTDLQWLMPHTYNFRVKTRLRVNMGILENVQYPGVKFADAVQLAKEYGPPPTEEQLAKLLDKDRRF